MKLLSAKKRMALRDLKEGWGRKARKEAKKRSYPCEEWHDDCGRKLSHYSTIHNELLKHCKGRENGQIRILHVGASTGVYTRYLQKLGFKATGFDINEGYLKIAKKIGNKRSVAGDLRAGTTVTRLPFKDESFDVFVSDKCLFNKYSAIDPDLVGVELGPFTIAMPSPQPFVSIGALQDLHRILRPGGIGILHAFRENLPAQKEFLSEIGFEIIEYRHFSKKEFNILVLRKKT